MSFFSIIVIAFGLSVDTFAVSVTNGYASQKINLKKVCQFSAIFCLMQSLMPVIGWFSGNQLKAIFNNYGFIVAFLILFVIGLKMIYEAVYKEKKINKSDSLNMYIVLLLAFATSIDALAVGFSFSLLGVNILMPIIIIGIITFSVYLFGFFIGEKFGMYLGSKMEIIGGIILILIGFNILFENF